MPQAQGSSTNPSVTAFKPRQVLLLSKQHNMKQHKASSSPETPENGSNPSDQNVILLNSIFLYLQRHGFSKTLKSFRSEINIESDGLEGCSLDLEEMCHKYLKSCNHAGTVSKRQKPETNDKKKKKKKRSDESNSNTVHEVRAANEVSEVKNSEERCTNDLVPESEMKSKEKKRKQISDSFGHGTEQLLPEAVKACDGDKVHELRLDKSGKRCKDKKKKKSKLVFESLDYNVEHHQSDDATAMNTSGTLLEESGKSKGEKRKSKSLASEGLCDGHKGELDKEKSKRIDSEKVDFQTSEGNALKKSGKCSKKRKQLACEENGYLPVDEENPGESKRRKIESEKELKESEQITMMNGFSASVGFTGKGTKGDNDQSQKTSEKQLLTHGNGIFDNNGGDKSSSQKIAKKLNESVEPKTVNAFQRVKIDEVVFADKRLQDNSYWAKDGAEIGYGAKAQEVLGQVRGRDFRHEKTKKKRGSYRGGQIDLQAHSIKFNYSDED